MISERRKLFWHLSLINYHLSLFCLRHGFLLIDKPSGITSHDAVVIVRNRLSERAVGHLGTLDPAATGLLVLAVGKKALKVVHLFGDLSKEYIADVHFGAMSSTYDREGVIEETPPKPGWKEPDQLAIQNLIESRFLGKIKQVPPSHSAVHVNGERAFRLAREGKEVIIPPRVVQIDSCNVLEYKYPNLKLRIACGSGTYIRSLAHDLGKLLWCGGYLLGLQRTRVGEWSLDHAKAPDAALWTDVIPLKEILKSHPSRELTSHEWEDISHGRNIEAEVAPNTIAWQDELPVAILVPGPDGTARAKKVF